MHRTTPVPPPAPAAGDHRLRTGAVLVGVCAASVAAPAWLITGSAAVAVLTALTTLIAVALATVMI